MSEILAVFPLARNIEQAVRVPKTRKPKTNGLTVPSYCIPIYVPNGTEMKVETEPTIAAPIPAICPKGSMAIELRFPNNTPTKKTVEHK